MKLAFSFPALVVSFWLSDALAATLLIETSPIPFSRVEGGYIATFGGIHLLLKYRKKQYPFPGPGFPTSAPDLIFDANFNKRMKAAVALNDGLRVVIAEEFSKDEKTLSGWVLQKQRWRRCVVRKARVWSRCSQKEILRG
jgi:hypothetical protein